MGTATHSNRLVHALALTTALLPAAASADEDQRWYASASVGFGMLDDTTLSFSDGVNGASAEGQFETSFTGGGGLGYRWSNGWALEGEIMYRRNELEPLDLPGLGSFSEGDFASLSLGLNALYHFDIGTSGKLKGYVGPGIVYFQEIDIDFDADGQQEISFESDDTALQLKLGARYDIAERWFVEAGATYLIADSVSLELPADERQTIDSDYRHWSASFGVGFRF